MKNQKMKYQSSSNQQDLMMLGSRQGKAHSNSNKLLPILKAAEHHKNKVNTPVNFRQAGMMT